MKLFRTFLMAASAALVCASTASAQTIIRIAGSTAYRGPTHTAITNVLTAGFTYGYIGGTLTGANQAIFTGQFAGNPVIIKTSFVGSVGGVQQVAKNVNALFLPNSTTQSAGAGTSGAAIGTEAGLPDVAMSDTYQSSTPFASPGLIDTLVGVVPFKWVANPGAPAGLVDITPQLAQVLFGNGSVALALFTGLPADRTTLVAPDNAPAQVFAVGRDPDSGTRLTAFAESGVGVNSLVVQYEPVISGAAVTSHHFWPPSQVNNINFPLGDGGYATGSALATTMTKTTFAAVGGYYVTYLSTGDAATVLGAVPPGKELTYNGATFSNTNVQEGRYTFWGYEHLMYRSSYAGIGKNFADALAARILNFDASLKISTMQVGRTADGGLVTPNY